jgi:hypothetical protein
MEELYKCMNCGKDCQVYYDISGNPKSARCDKCNKKMYLTIKKIEDRYEKEKLRSKNKKIIETKKKFKDKSPFEVLAYLKFMLKRSKNKFEQTPQGWWIKSSTSDSKDSILQECYDILDAYDIPSKYLIAEALDSKET